MDGYISKPVNSRELADVLEQVSRTVQEAPSPA